MVWYMMELYHCQDTSWTRIYWILLVLTLLYSHSTLASNCTITKPVRARICHAQSEFPEWCNCNKTNISLTEPGITARIKKTSLLYLFSNANEASIYRCPDKDKNEICLCDANFSGDDEKNCRQCKSADGKNMVCLQVVVTNVVKIHDYRPIPHSDCIFSDICNEACDCERKRTEVTLMPAIGPKMTDPPNPATNSKRDASDVENVTFIVAGIVVFTVILILVIVIIVCCRKNKDILKKNKEGAQEAVYSTIDSGSLPNGNVNGHLYPNQFYDAHIGTPPVPPSRPEVPIHHKSMPSLQVMNGITTEFQDPQYQPYLPHHQAIWKNRPTLHRYTSTGGMQTGYKTYGSDEVLPAESGTYMYLNKNNVDPSQTLPYRGTTEPTPEEIERFRVLASDGRPGYRKEVVKDEKLITEEYTLLKRDPRSLPVEGSPREYQDYRQNATYGFERKKQSRTNSLKPIPAKRGQYRSKGDVVIEEEIRTNDQNSSDSDNEDYQGLGSEGSPFYFQMNSTKSNDSGNVVIVTENKGNPEITEKNTTGPEKKKNSRRKPKPRSRQRRRPTTEVTCPMMENPLASSHDEDESPSAGEYTDDDIEDGLNRIEGSNEAIKQQKEGCDLGDSDYHSPESNST